MKLGSGMVRALLPGMGVQTDIADMFLAVFANRDDAQARAETFIARLEASPYWRPEEIQELRLLISDRLEEAV